MRERFIEVTAAALDSDDRLALVLADIGVALFDRTGVTGRHPRRVVNVGIREQLLIGIAAGFALEGMRPIVHSYAPFLVERPYEQVKLDLGHQDVGAVLVSYGGSWDAAHEGRTHQAPEDVVLLSALPGWTIDVPGHPDELERSLVEAFASNDRIYIRLAEDHNAEPVAGEGLVVLRRGGERAPLVLAVGPLLDSVLEATRDLDATVGYLSRVRPFDAAGLRASLGGTDIVLVEPYLAGTSAAEISAALVDRSHRLLALGVENRELRRYGTAAEHRAAHGLDSAGIRRSLDGFLTA